ncbi:MAG: hypothetical protein FJX92_09060 [Bacteroidetes bacterium]|nr:hypothetical protein [Bacteroidota bacterium]
MKKVTLILCVKLMAVMMLASCTGGGTKDEEPPNTGGGIKDEEPPNKTTLSKEVTIGKQVWMTQNLDVDKFRNGEVIPEAKTDGEWKAYADAGEAAWCYYENDPANGEIYGKLYNWYAVSDSRGLAPVGYHIPSDAEWTLLTDYSGGAEKAGAKMKSKQGWAEDGNGTNSSGFSGLPGGNRNSNGSFDLIG